MVELGEPGTPLICWAITGAKNTPEPITMRKTSIPADMSLKLLGNTLSKKDLRRVSIILISCLIPKWVSSIDSTSHTLIFKGINPIFH
jgi:hypothetical protein